MKRLRATARMTGEDAPKFYNLLADSEDIAEARLLDINTTVNGVETLLFAIDGDPSTFEREATDSPGIESVEIASRGCTWSYALVVMRPAETPLFGALQRLGPRAGLVIRTPIVYRGGEVQCRAVGDPAPLQAALDVAPDAFEVRIDEVGSFRGDLDDPRNALSDRQLEVLRTAHRLDYYEQPRGATHKDVAAELDCSPVTVSDHLQRAEAKLVDAVLDDLGPEI
ncbi:helix-turn-helix domain-containing protein [Haloarcula sp. JP-L23]|uniref:helix-turn-helix domain-containing protein n=1 Tax=Haloarcula sp. JP-L23 TaxID=2716717 RepID=UPI00140F29BE|nr:DNA-binding protein [Haloarcula sp. JP-L23]